MSNPTFLKYEKPLITAMVKHTATPQSCIEEITRAISAGAEAFGFQGDNFPREYHTKEDLCKVFGAMQGKPIYVTNYPVNHNEGLSYEELSEELLFYIDCGATLADLTGDFFCRTEGELTADPEAIRKQMDLIRCIHKRGGEVLMSSHINKFTPAERVLEVALEHRRRGADVSKIVVHSNTMEKQMENLRITAWLKEKIDFPFLFLAGGESCRIQRRVGLLAGNCMSLCMLEAPEGVAVTTQPLITEQLRYRDELNLM